MLVSHATFAAIGVIASFALSCAAQHQNWVLGVSNLCVDENGKKVWTLHGLWNDGWCNCEQQPLLRKMYLTNTSKHHLSVNMDLIRSEPGLNTLLNLHWPDCLDQEQPPGSGNLSIGKNRFLLGHEYFKHGSCTGWSLTEYLQRAIDVFLAAVEQAGKNPTGAPADLCAFFDGIREPEEKHDSQPFHPHRFYGNWNPNQGCSIPLSRIKGVNLPSVMHPIVPTMGDRFHQYCPGHGNHAETKHFFYWHYQPDMPEPNGDDL